MISFNKNWKVTLIGYFFNEVIRLYLDLIQAQ